MGRWREASREEIGREEEREELTLLTLKFPLTSLLAYFRSISTQSMQIISSLAKLPSFKSSFLIVLLEKVLFIDP